MLHLALFLTLAGGCAHDVSRASVHAKVRKSGSLPRRAFDPGVAVEVLDVGSRFSPFGSAAPKSLGTAITDRRGSFGVVVASTYRCEQIGVEFPGRDNLEMMARDVHVVEVGVTPTVPAR